jgi:hypothetical protein
MDPAAFGTAHIGLEAIRRREAAESSATPARSRQRRTSTRHTIRVTIARSLRAAANAIDRQSLERAGGA